MTRASVATHSTDAPTDDDDDLLAGLRSMAPSQSRGLERSLGLEKILMAVDVIEHKPIAIGRYEIGERLGQGAMGSVYRARDPELQRDVAIKVLHREITPEDTSLIDQEAKALARLEHPNVVTVYDLGTTDGQLYVAMQFVSGTDLLRALLGPTPPGWRETVRMFIAAGRGLAAAHAAGVIHRDFKPENVLVGDDGAVKLADFGLARQAGHQGRQREIAGTFKYMAPEVKIGEPADARSDQYSYCAAIWRMLDPTTPLGASTTSISPLLQQSLARGLSEAPEDRWPSVDALLTVLENDLEEQPHDHARIALLQGVERKWIAGTLADLLGGKTPARRPITTVPDQVDRPWATLLPMSSELARDTEDLGTQLELGNGSLLVLGDEGVGKTVALLRLAESLAQGARAHRTAPAPAVLELESFGAYRGSFRSWVEDELVTRYGLPRESIATWMDEDSFALLLDGLDRIGGARRRQTIQAIGEFRAEQPIPLAVTCRTESYREAGMRFRFGAAVEIVGRRPRFEVRGVRVSPSDEDVERAMRDARPPADKWGNRDTGLAKLLDTVVSRTSTPEKIGRFVVEARIEAASSESIYRAYDPDLQRTIVVQLIADDEGDVAMREAKALAALEHANVVAVYDVGRAGPEVYLAMEHVPGETLEAWIKAHADATWREIVSLFVQAGRGLLALRHAGVSRRAFDPSDVLVGDDGRVRLRGFGGSASDDASPRAAFAYALDDALRRLEAASAARLPRGLRQLVRATATPRAGEPTTLEALVDALEGLLDPAVRDRDRELLLDRVQRFWIDGVLLSSLDDLAPLPLWIRAVPDAVAPDDAGAIALPEHRSTEDLRDVLDLAGRVVVLGAAGSGKTLALLRLAQQLLEEAKADPDSPVPVVVNLSSWPGNQGIAEWVEDEILTKYALPRRSTRGWLERGRLALLLDGLDEVPAPRRAAATEAINAFARRHDVSVVVAAREDEYLAGTARLEFPLAVALEPLDDVAIEGMVDELGDRAEGLRQALLEDPALLEHARTPLVLGVLAVAGPDAAVEPAKFREALYHRYVDAVFTRRRSGAPYSKKVVVLGLQFLAAALRNHGHAELWLEQLQRSWLPRRWQRGLAMGLGLAGLMFVTLVINVLVLLPWHPLGHAVMSGFTVAVLAIPLCMYFVGTTKIVPVEALTWSWVALRRRAPATVVFGLLAAGGYGLMFSSTVGLVMSLPALVGLAAMRGIVPREALGKIVPNEGMVQSGFNALAFGIAVGLLTGGSFSLLFQPVLDAMYGRPALLAMHVKPGWPTFWGVAGAFGCIAGLTYGGIALGMHIALRLVVAATTPLPLRLQPFLDYAVERTLLRRVGAGYIFPHRALLEYFAERAPQPESRT